jgi:hypothetical protein
MKTAIWAWRLHRLILDHAGLTLPFSRRTGRKRMLFISERAHICRTQLFPFYFHASDFVKQGIESRELPLKRFIENRHGYRGKVDAVCFQTWFDLSREAMEALVQDIQQTWPGAKLAYFDWFAPTDIRFAEILDKHIAAYMKKHVLSDCRQYGKPTLGDTQLTDYYARRFNLDLPETTFAWPDGFHEKLFLSPHFAFSAHMLPYFMGRFPDKSSCSIDLHSRITLKGAAWYTHMRQEALDKVLARESNLNVVCRGRVGRDKYFEELFNSKLCFSPFGYGEVCWRDFEAMLTGSLLLKPDMAHLSCCPDVFSPYETYVPLAWDLSDFDEKVDHYLTNQTERETIARNAFDRLHCYFKEQHFLRDIQPFLARMGLV